MNSKYPPAYQSWLTLCLGIAFYFSGFFHRMVTAVMARTVSGISNMGMEMGPMILQPAIGLVLDFRWDGLSENGIRIYDLNAYHLAFGVIIGLSILGAVLITFAKETFCQQLHE